MEPKAFEKLEADAIETTIKFRNWSGFASGKLMDNPWAVVGLKAEAIVQACEDIRKAIAQETNAR